MLDNCPHCGAAMADAQGLSPGDWIAWYRCGYQVHADGRVYVPCSGDGRFYLRSKLRALEERVKRTAAQEEWVAASPRSRPSPSFWERLVELFRF